MMHNNALRIGVNDRSATPPSLPIRVNRVFPFLPYKSQKPSSGILTKKCPLLSTQVHSCPLLSHSCRICRNPGKTPCYISSVKETYVDRDPSSLGHSSFLRHSALVIS